MCVTWLFQYVWHDSFNMCDMTHSIYAWHDSFNVCDVTPSMCVTWLIQCVWRDSFDMYDMTHSICVTWLIQYVWHDSFNMSDMTRSRVAVSWPLTWRVMSHIWMSHVAQIEWVMSHTLIESCLTNIEWVTSHILNKSCHTYWMSHVTGADRETATQEWVMLYILNESCHTYIEWVLEQLWLCCTANSCVTWLTYICSAATVERLCSTHMNVRKSCHTYEWVISHISVSHVTYDSYEVATVSRID